MNKLVQTKELRTNYWKELANKKSNQVIRYDEDLDMLFIYFSGKEKDRIITHFVDDNVAFLYRYSDKEIIGMRIDEFRNEFLGRCSIPQCWKLSDSGESLPGMKDIVFFAKFGKVEEKKHYLPTRNGIELEPAFV